MHKVVLDCELFQAEANLALRPGLPIEWISVILGNDLAGGQVLAGVPSPLALVPLAKLEPDEGEQDFLKLFQPAQSCVMTASKSESVSFR